MITKEIRGKHMKKRISAVTFHYMIITAGFWMSFCFFTAYAQVFLTKGAGYDKTAYGIIVAAGNIGGALLGPLLGAWIDRNRNIRHANVINILLILQAFILVILRLSPVKGLVCTLSYALYMMVAIPVNAINLDLCVRLEHAKAPLNFGLARSMGSLGFAVLSVILGILTSATDYRILPIAGLAVTAIQAVGNMLTNKDLKKAEADVPPEEATVIGKSASLMTFFRENKSFCLMLFGTILIFIAHNIDGNFLLELVENLGGNETTLGYLAAFTAIVEVPVMILSTALLRRWPCVLYIRAAFIFFILKILAYTFAPNIPLFFAARLLQAPSYALYTVLIVTYADETVNRKDSAKAQSLAASMAMIGAVLALLIGGWMFDHYDIRTTMMTAVVLVTVGAAIALAATFRKRSRKSC